MVSEEGAVKVLDFGLAKAWDTQDRDGSLSLSPTLTQHATAAGVILGTAAYMSPEQARGKHVDKRADIWAFGVLLYEMLTGQRLFEGETTSDTLASVLKNPVDFDRLEADLPVDISWVLQRCLDRNPTRRLRDIGEARILLEDVADGVVDTDVATSSAAPAAAGGSGASRLLPWAVAVVAAVVALGFASIPLWIRFLLVKETAA